MKSDVVTEPDDAEVVQVEGEPSLTCIPVVVQGPVRTVELPSKSGGLFTVAAVGITTGVRIVSRDPRRKRVTVNALDQDIRIGTTQAQAEQLGARWPANVPLVYTSGDELWATSITGTTGVSVIVENWAD